MKKNKKQQPHIKVPAIEQLREQMQVLKEKQEVINPQTTTNEALISASKARMQSFKGFKLKAIKVWGFTIMISLIVLILSGVGYCLYLLTTFLIGLNIGLNLPILIIVYILCFSSVWLAFLHKIGATKHFYRVPKFRSMRE